MYYLKIKCHLVLLCLLVSTVVQAQTDSLLPAKELSVRNGLPNFFAKVKAGKTTRVAFLGGSITRAGNGYRDQLLSWFRNTYPQCKFEEIMAAVSGTGSDFGACRVQQHVIDHRPDLVFIEFAVNDNRMRMQLVRETMEGIVRQIRKASSKTEICFIYTLAKENLPELEKGLFPASVSAMEAIAEHYNIPTIHMGLQVVDEIAKGKLVITGKKEESSAIPIFSVDGVHPLPETGHKIYTQVLTKCLLQLQDNGITAKHTMVSALEPYNWRKAGMISSWKKATFKGDWQLTDSVTKRREYYQLLPRVYGTAAKDASLTIQFKGSLFGLADIMGPSTAAVEITIDQQQPRVINRFDAFCTYYRLNYFIISDRSPGKHVATIRLAPGAIDKAAILKTRNAMVNNWQPYEKNAMYIGAIFY